ncbi:MAG: RES family NAD+ phosphorylase, partial [Hyphomicrobiales bacterium]|nr:RES family NAD+ phosphorylase [Hyphomicrobiales bacterium]
AFSPAELTDILKHPARQLGAPPSRRAQAGRMNAAGISVFYGAQDLDTCVAEVRAPVGSSVILGRFEFVRPVRLLDLDALAEIYVKASHFDPDFRELRGRAAFLSHLARTISRPVMPSDETFEYLPTQVVSEYLATRGKPPVDGMLFRSSQTGGKGRNLVMFNHASVAEQDDIPPNTEIDVYMDSGPPDDPDTSITVFENLPPEKPPKEKEGRENLFGVPFLPIDPHPSIGDGEAWLAKREPTLRLNNDSVRVLQIDAVHNRWHERNVQRLRVFKDKKHSF